MGGAGAKAWFCLREYCFKPSLILHFTFYIQKEILRLARAVPALAQDDRGGMWRSARARIRQAQRGPDKTGVAQARIRQAQHGGRRKSGVPLLSCLPPWGEVSRSDGRGAFAFCCPARQTVCGSAYMSKKGVPLYREGHAFTETLPQTTSAYEYAVLPR